MGWGNVWWSEGFILSYFKPINRFLTNPGIFDWSVCALTAIAIILSADRSFWINSAHIIRHRCFKVPVIYLFVNLILFYFFTVQYCNTLIWNEVSFSDKDIFDLQLLQSFPSMMLSSSTMEDTTLINGLDGLGYIASRMISFSTDYTTKLILQGGGHPTPSVFCHHIWFWWWIPRWFKFFIFNLFFFSSCQQYGYYYSLGLKNSSGSE